jgi:DNA-binding NtrC family response regulator
MTYRDGSKRILVIDDEVSTLKMLRLLLRTYGYTVLTAESGEEGLAVFRKEAPQIVLTDIRMPGMNGIEVLKELKNIDPEAEVIVFTGHGDMDLAIRSLQNEASDFINKPVQRQALEVALKRAEEKIGLRRQIRDYTQNLETKVAEATAELSWTCQQLDTLQNISRLVGEAASLSEIVEILQDRINSISRLKCYRILVIDSSGRSFFSPEESEPGKIPSEFVDSLKTASQMRPLTREEMEQIAFLFPEEHAKKMMVIPVYRGGDTPIAFALIGAPTESSGDDIPIVSLLLSQASGAIRRAALQEEELSALRVRAKERDRFGDMIGRHEKMARIYTLIETIADTEATVLILGESGTGKELVARRIHELSHRKKGPFVVINCAAFPQTLIESELFGYEKGAFTGATHARRGSFEVAHGGSIVLDEIGEIPLATQVKLLRVIQFREFQRIGSESITKVDVRVVAATSRNLRHEMEQGSFREDLYYRLHVIPIIMPPLRERMTDLPLLIRHFIEKLRVSTGKKVYSLTPDATSLLMRHGWSGNVRELENVIEHAFILAKGDMIRAKDLPAYLKENMRVHYAREDALVEAEKEHLVRVLNECSGNKIQAARRLRISRSTLYRKLEQYGLADKDSN